jgi:alkylated DNA repair dioxygenase AlkB
MKLLSSVCLEVNMIYLINDFVPQDFKQELLSFLETQQITQKQGPRWTEPRLTCWFSKNNVNYTYSGITHKPLPWVTNLDVLCNEIFKVYQVNGIEVKIPNSIMVNVYRDGSDYCSKHADDEDLFGVNPTIASLSFGATRDFQVFENNKLLHTYALKASPYLCFERQ